MKFLEAMNLISEGKKVRMKDWKVYEYIYSNDGEVCWFNGNPVGNIPSIGEWEIYDEREEADGIIIELYNILSEIQKNHCSYDEFLDSSDVGDDNVDYAFKLYHQLQLMNRAYKLDVKSDCK